ncbi:MAG: DnaD domain protein, partial [Firmicutes bacterium]|nr:DnaD domain protein [Bacillota bacterium]
PETIVEAFRYAAVSRKKTRVSYVEKIVEEWAGKGLLTADAIREHLEAHDERHALYRRVLRALGFYRNATEEEERLMDAWFDDYGFPIGRVLEACKKTAGIANPNLKYVNTVLRGWYRDEHGTDPASKEGPLEDPADPSRVTAAFVRKRMAEYAALREEEEADAERRREAVYAKYPRVKAIEEEIHTLSMQATRMALGGTGLGAAAATQSRLAALEREKKEILGKAGLTPADLAIRYTCEKCRDTGYLDDGSRCDCFVKADRPALG